MAVILLPGIATHALAGGAREYGKAEKSLIYPLNIVDHFTSAT
jgi:hypothetical protein